VTLYEQAGGFDAILALCRRWHELCSADPLAGHPFEHMTLAHHDERLAAYLAEAFGGPPLYTAGYGDESFMQRLHAGNGVHPELDEACLALFEQALADVGIAEPAAREIAAYFRGATAAMDAYQESPAQVPDGLPLNYAVNDA
jgi:hemoglobin